MNFSINLGNWNSVFVVPTSVVDKHIKLAGVAQLKVLLWILRHAGDNLSIENIAEALSMHPADVKDSMQYWIETKLLATFEDCITPGKDKEIPEPKEKSSEHTSLKRNQEINKDNSIEHKPKLRSLSRALKPDSLYTAERINSDPEIKYLTQEAQVILGRPISNADCATLLMLHDNDGLPVQVIIMVLQYAVSIGKSNMKYIEKMAISWAQEEIDTIEKAEKKIISLNEHQKAWKIVEKIIGIERRSPTSKEDEFSNRWINEWKFNESMIREAYERCVDSKGKYIASYMDSIIKRWHSLNIYSIEQAKEENFKLKSKKFDNSKRTPSYNIEEYERYSIFDDNNNMEVV